MVVYNVHVGWHFWSSTLNVFKPNQVHQSPFFTVHFPCSDLFALSQWWKNKWKLHTFWIVDSCFTFLPLSSTFTGRQRFPPPPHLPLSAVSFQPQAAKNAKLQPGSNKNTKLHLRETSKKNSSYNFLETKILDHTVQRRFPPKPAKNHNSVLRSQLTRSHTLGKWNQTPTWQKNTKPQLQTWEYKTPQPGCKMIKRQAPKSKVEKQNYRIVCASIVATHDCNHSTVMAILMKMVQLISGGEHKAAVSGQWMRCKKRAAAAIFHRFLHSPLWLSGSVGKNLELADPRSLLCQQHPQGRGSSGVC